MNPALRTFYYRLLRLIALSIHPVFVFDGPNKPPFKRNKKTGGPGASVASIPEFLAKQLLKQFGFPIHLAPGEAEAECALLQREGIVDIVLSEDVDTLMFGSGKTIRNWSPEQKSGKTPTHVNMYDAVETKNGPSGLDREGMILVALMSGGDYVPEGIPGCGPKTACEAARAGFGRDLCKIAKGDTAGIERWRERLRHEIKTNESKLFKRKCPSMVIPDDFPRSDILGYYTHPAISNQTGLEKLKRSMKWDQDFDFPGLREFTHDAFDWVGLEGAKHFVRSLSPSLLVRQLRMRGEHEGSRLSDIQAIQEDEALLVKGIHGKRQHPTTDNTTELRVSFIPIELVKIDLSIEDANEVSELAAESEVSDDDDQPKKRGPTKFDPEKPARAWVMETFVKVGIPLKAQDWEGAQRKPLGSQRTAIADDGTINHPLAQTTSRTTARSAAPKPRTTRRAKPTETGTQMLIQNFARVTKPGVKPSQTIPKPHSTTVTQPVRPEPKKTIISLLSSSPPRSPVRIPSRAREEPASPLPELPSTVTRRRRGPIQRAHTLPSPSAVEPTYHSDIETLDLTELSPQPQYRPQSPTPAPKPVTTMRRVSPPAAWKAKPKKKREIVLRKSLAGAWTFVESESPAKTGAALADDVVLKGKERRRWRESEVEVLDLC